MSTFRIFNFQITILNLKVKPYNEIVELLFNHKKLQSIKLMKTHFKIGLKEAKQLTDEISTIDYFSDQYIFHKTKKESIVFLYKNLEKHRIKVIQ